jgi:hypothetical protein
MINRLKWWLLIALAVFGLVLVASKSRPTAEGAAVPFQYKVLSQETLMYSGTADLPPQTVMRPESKMQRGLNKLGEEGWQLISVEAGMYYLVKR